MYEKFYAHCLFPMVQRLLGRNTLSVIKELGAAQWYSQEQIREMQLEKLKALLSYAVEHVPYYRELFRKLGITPSHIQNFEDFASLPLLSKEQIQADHKQFLSETVSDYSIVTTSGSTGTPLSYPTNTKVRGHHIADMICARGWWGIHIGDKQMMLWGRSGAMAPGLEGKKQKISQIFKDRMANRSRCEAYELGDENLYKYYKKMIRLRPDYIYGFASSVYLFSDFIRRKELDIGDIFLKGVVTTSELIYEKERKVIESVFRTPVINEYGMVEAGIIAYSCPEGNMHVMDPSVYVEKLPVGGNEDSDIREIVVTSFANLAAPMIRYQTKDLVKIGNDDCACGRGFSVLGKLIGRVYDLIQTTDGKRVAGEYVTDVLEYVPGIRQFQLIQKDWSHFIFRIVKEPYTYQEQSESKIRSKFKEVLGDRISIDFDYVPAIDSEPSGKHRLVVSKVGQRIN